MAGLKETVQVNIQGAILGVQEGGYSFMTQLQNLPAWKRFLLIGLAASIIPVYIVLRIGTEQYLTLQYGREALSAQAAFNSAQSVVVGKMTIIKNPNNTYSAVALVINPNLDLSATGVEYTATFQGSDNKTVYSTKGEVYLLANEKKYLVFPRIESDEVAITSGKIELAEIDWQKRINVPEVKLRATEPILYDEANPLTFVVEGSIINDSPYSIATIRIVYLLFGDNNEIIGVSQRDESRIVPFGRRAYKQLWPGLYRSDVKKVQVIPVTNTLDARNITIETNAPVTNTNTSTDGF